MTPQGQPGRRSWFALLLDNGGRFAGVSLAAALICCVFYGLALQRGLDLERSGAEVTGQVTALTSAKERSCGRHHCSFDLVAFDFTAGGIWHGAVEVGARTFRQLHLGGPVTLRYLPGDPSVAEIDAGTVRRAAELPAASSLLAALVFGFVLVRCMALASRLIYLRDKGVTRSARVILHQPVQGPARFKGVVPWVMTWRDETGLPGISLEQSQFNLPPVGATITLHVDPRGRWPAVWARDCGAG